MQHRMARVLAIGATAAAMACATQPPATTVTRTTTTTTSSGDVALNAPAGMWVDSMGGTWMDSNGTLWAAGPTGVRLGVPTATLRALTDANIVAHLAGADSLEVALSQLGADRAQNESVRDFARRMVTEHSAHLQLDRQTAAQSGITPVPSVVDTVDATMAAGAMTRLANMPAGPAFDRQLMGAEVMMHTQLLRELEAVQPSTGPARDLVAQTVPVVRQHLADARAIWRQVGGPMSDRTNP